MMDTNILMFNSGNKSNLDRAYNKHINKVLTNLDEEQESRWETYGVIIQELIKNKKENLLTWCTVSGVILPTQSL